MTAHLHQLRDSRSTDSINTLLIAAAAGQTTKHEEHDLAFSVFEISLLIFLLSCEAPRGFSMALRRRFDFSAVLNLLSQSVESLVTSEIRLCLSLSFSISLSLYLPSPLFSPHPHLCRDFVISFCMTLDRMMEKRPLLDVSLQANPS